jgi:hypothetical protein
MLDGLHRILGKDQSRWSQGPKKTGGRSLYPLVGGWKLIKYLK